MKEAARRRVSDACRIGRDSAIQNRTGRRVSPPFGGWDEEEAAATPTKPPPTTTTTSIPLRGCEEEETDNTTRRALGCRGRHSGPLRLTPSTTSVPLWGT